MPLDGGRGLLNLISGDDVITGSGPDQKISIDLGVLEPKEFSSELCFRSRFTYRRPKPPPYMYAKVLRSHCLDVTLFMLPEYDVIKKLTGSNLNGNSNPIWCLSY